MTIKIKPLHDRIVVKRIEKESRTAGGLIIPDTVAEKPMEGEVIAVGDGSFQNGQKIPLQLKVGDKILFGKWGGTEVTIDGEEYLIMKESDALAVLNK